MATELKGPKLRGATKVVELYLNALDTQHNPRGRRTPEYIKRRYAEVEAALAENSVSPLERLSLIQERINLEASLTAAQHVSDLEALTKDFVAIGAEWSRAKGITYNAWRLMKVPAAVLKEAGIS